MRHLAVDRETGDLWIEDNDFAIRKCQLLGSEIDFYPIVLDEDNKPSLGEARNDV